MNSSTLAGEVHDLQSVLSDNPELLVKYQAFISSFWKSKTLDRRLLELARLRVAMIHSCEAELKVRDCEVVLTQVELDALDFSDWSAFSSSEQSVLRVVEKVPFNHQQVSDADVEELSLVLGHRGCVAILIATAFFDVNCRLKMVFDVAAPLSTEQAIEQVDFLTTERIH